MKSDWPSETKVHRLLKKAVAGEPADLLSYLSGSPLRATDSTYSCLVIVRDHNAWYIGGWRDANVPVEKGGRGMQMINYFDEGFWSKLAVPFDKRVRSVTWEESHFLFETDQGVIRSTPTQLKRAVVDSITGRGLSKKRIAHNFGKLDGSVPLDSMRV